MTDLKVDDLIAMLEPYRGKEVYVKCAHLRLDIKEVKLEKLNYEPYNGWEERVVIVPDSGDMFDIFHDD